MSAEFQPHHQWLDEHSANQYRFPVAARVRRELLEYTVDRKDHYGDAIRSLWLSGNERILNIGTGDGLDEVRLTTEFGHKGQIVGLDVPSADDSFDERFLLAQDKLTEAGKRNVAYVPGYAQALPFKDNSFDVALVWHASYHFMDLETVLREIQRVLVHGGTLSHLTNDQDNKPKHHKIVKDIKARLGVPDHQPFSANFNLQRSREVLPIFFVPGITPLNVNQDSEYVITEKTIPNIVLSIDSYRSTVPRELYEPWVGIRQEIVQSEVISEISQNGVFVDRVKRGGGNFKNLFDASTARTLGSRALGL